MTAPTPRSNPYGMVVTRAGVPYLTCSAPTSSPASTRSRGDPQYPLPAARARRAASRSPRRRDLLFRLRARVSRAIRSKTGAVKWPLPSGPQSRRYAIRFLKGAIWYTETGVRPNTLVRFGPQTQKFASWPIPSGGSVVRNMMPTIDGSGLVIACSGVNQVALVVVSP